MISGPDIGRRQQVGDRLIKHQMLVDDGAHIFRLDADVHRAFRINHHAGAEMAGAEAAGVGQLKARSPQVAGRKFVRKGLPGGGKSRVGDRWAVPERRRGRVSWVLACCSPG